MGEAIFKFLFKYPPVAYERGRLTLASGWPGWLLVLLILAGAAAFGYFLWKQQSKLTREKTRAETELIRARIAGTLAPEKVDVTHDARDTLAERFARLAGAVEPGRTGPGDPPPETGGG